MVLTFTTLEEEWRLTIIRLRCYVNAGIFGNG